jgi:hypothetical protein
MANTGDLIYSRLSANGTISALVSTRISPQWVQENSALPYISYNMIAGVGIMVKNEDTFQDKELWQINVFDTNYDQAKTLAAAVRADLEGYSGTTASVEVKNIVYEGSSENSEGRVFQVSVELEINRVL